ncbi:hotdog fold domain-containing protein [Nocardioides jiangxiensis]|uniref:Hotdog fold domain-containing protein n=1 Tax=Nocardioides jiangxiensis TaxID=3064524 RepID=A0ABT9B050_9ACTN|nr:hotdog fold domain-containing protein [Nocardioides sp. WY-20]MDO7867674.1 hotdog fold domain-containing protein [Nocardioides sp. WY-20]
MSALGTLWAKTNGLPMGKKIFSTLYSQKAPYFATIHATVTELRPNYAELQLPKRRSVQNHIGTVHAIALCNGAEMAMGALAEVTVPSDKRWIPKGMSIAYTAKADSDITVIAETDPEQWQNDGDLDVRVKAVTTAGTVCFEGVIKLWISSKKK